MAAGHKERKGRILSLHFFLDIGNAIRVDMISCQEARFWDRQEPGFGTRPRKRELRCLAGGYTHREWGPFVGGVR